MTQAADLMNPFEVDPKVEFAQESTGEDLWTEFCFFFAYDPAADVGVSIHAGREPVDPSIWRATIAVILPGGEELLVAKKSGRGGDERGAGAGGFKAACVEPMQRWTIAYDGMMCRSTRAELCAGPGIDDVSEYATFDLTFEGASPFWDLKANMDRQSWASGHWEQICQVTGDFRVGGETIAMADGSGVRDHSFGSRDYDGVLGNFWMNTRFPGGRTFMAQNTLGGSAHGQIRHGYVFWGDGSPLEIVELADSPDVSNTETPDGYETSDPLAQESLRRQSLVLGTSRGPQTIEWELLHSVATTYIAPSDEVLGTDFRRRDALQLTESVARVTWDGETGWGNRERVAGIRTLR
jgi:hypothetical protein